MAFELDESKNIEGMNSEVEDVEAVVNLEGELVSTLTEWESKKKKNEKLTRKLKYSNDIIANLKI